MLRRSFILLIAFMGAGPFVGGAVSSRQIAYEKYET